MQLLFGTGNFFNITSDKKCFQSYSNKPMSNCKWIFFFIGASKMVLHSLQWAIFNEGIFLRYWHWKFSTPHSLGIKSSWSSELLVGSSVLAAPLANVSSVYYLFWAPLETQLRTLPVWGQYMWNRPVETKCFDGWREQTKSNNSIKKKDIVGL